MHASCGSRVFQWSDHSPQPRDWCRYSVWIHQSIHPMASYEDYVDVESGSEHSVVFYHHMQYQFDDGSTARVVPSAAWCFDCQRLVVSEHLDSKDEIETTRMKLISIISGSKEFVNDFFWPETPTTLDAQIRLNELESYWKKFDCRKSPERCLACGGTNIQKTNSRLSEATNIANGLTLKCVSSGLADVGIEPKIVLNAEGQRSE